MLLKLYLTFIPMVFLFMYSISQDDEKPKLTVTDFYPFLQRQHISFKVPKGFKTVTNINYPDDECPSKINREYLVDMEVVKKKHSKIYIFLDFDEYEEMPLRYRKEKNKDVNKAFIGSIKAFCDSSLMIPKVLDEAFTRSIGFDMAVCFKRNCTNIGEDGKRYYNFSYSLHKIDRFDIFIGYLYRKKDEKKISKVFERTKRMFMLE